MGSRATSLFGLWGLVLLVFGVVAWALTPDANLYVLAHVGLGFLLLVLYLTSGRESLTTVLGQRSTRYGANALVYSLVFLAILVVGNWLAARHNYRWDLTAQSIFSLSTQSKAVLAELEEPVEVHAFVEGGVDPYVSDLLDSYAQASSEFKFHMVDPIRERDLTERFTITEVPTLHIQHGERTATVNREITEESVTNGLIKATSGTTKTACFVDGHGEPDTESQEAGGASLLRDALRNENYEVKKVLLASEESVPADCTILVVFGTDRPYFDHEIDLIRRSLEEGRGTLFLVSPRRGAQLVPLLEPWGVELTDSVVVDQVVRLFQGPALGLQILASTYGTHAITRDFAERTIFPLARATKADAAAKPGVQAIEIVQSSPSAWGETDVAGVFERGEARLEDGDHRGPVPLAVAATGSHKEMGFDGTGETKVVVVGDGDFAKNQFFSQLFNRDLVLNMVNWLGGQEELISIRPRSITASRAELSPDETRRIFYLSVLVMPELLLFLGLTVWWRRSTK